jgi:signal peptidase I
VKRRTRQPKARATYSRRIVRTRNILLGLISVALAWIWVMPRTIGGLNTYTVVSGISMEPTFHTGDLIISRKADSYNIGDVVTYKIPDAKYDKFRIVHRVIGKTDDGHYEIQGDNQDHADPWSVPGENIAGAKVIMIPQGGTVLGYARNPIGLALLFGAIVTWTVWPKKTEADEVEDPIVALLGQAPAIRLEALMADDPFDVREPLVVGTSLTYAQFLNRPTLRDVVQTQALQEIKIPEPTIALDERSFFHEALFEQHLTEWINRQAGSGTQDEASKTNEQPKDEIALGQLGFEGTGGLSEQALRRATVIQQVIDRAHRREMLGQGVFGPDDLDSELLGSELGNESNKLGSVDELLERWINDDADAPLPEFLELV